VTTRTFILSEETMQEIFSKSALEPKPTYREFPLDEGSQAIPCCSAFYHPQAERPHVGPERPYEFGSSYLVGDGIAASMSRMAHLLTLLRLEVEFLQEKIGQLECTFMEATS
jgi:hypothetical protein